jgi:CheY-like chemotaxis protein
MGARLLVVEDTPHNLELMSFLLRAYGHTVESAVSGEQGIELAHAVRPDLVIMDLQLPGIDGYQAFAALRSDPSLPRMPVVAVTAFAMADDHRKAVAAGFYHYMTKPIDPPSFVDEIDSCLPEPLRGQRPTPVDAEPAANDWVTSHEPSLYSGARILVVDDSRANRELLNSVLVPHGFQVTLATTVEEGIELSSRAAPDLVLCDIHVGSRHGIDVLRHIRATPALTAVPFAFITATEVWLDADIWASEMPILRRPIEPAALIAHVETLLNPAVAG